MNDKQKAFVILSPGFASSETDSTCLPMQQSFVRSISKLYPEIEIIVLSFQYPFFEKTYKWFDATVISFNGRNRGGLQGIFLRRSVSSKLKAIHKTKQIVGLLSFWLGECAYIGKKFAERNSITHYCWLLGQDARANNKYLKRFSIRSNELIALSDFLQEEFQRNYSIKPASVIPPGVNEINFTHASREVDLLAVGSLIPLKQFEIFVDAVAAIKKHLPGVTALLVGDGPEKDNLEKLITTHNLKNNVTITGEIGHEEVINTMQRAKILLHPSSYEGFSGVCQEALSSGAHVISFCRAMNTDIPQWHIVKSKEKMIEKALQILKTNTTTYSRTKFSSMENTARMMMHHYLQRQQ